MLDGADQQWMVEDFYPRLARNGVHHVAFVVPEKTLVHIPVRRMNKAYGEKGAIEFQYHPTRAKRRRPGSATQRALRRGGRARRPTVATWSSPQRALYSDSGRPGRRRDAFL